MAVLSKHGEEVGRLEYLTFNVSVRSHGKLLRNSGDGWKLWRKCKPGCTPQDVFESRRNAMFATAAERPTFAQYKRRLHDEFPLDKRLLAHAVIESMPQDPDGCWSEFNDYLDCSMDFETVKELCNLWQRAETEFDEWKARQSAKATAETVAA